MGRALLLFSEFVTKRVNEKCSEQCLSVSITRVTVLVSNTGKPLCQTLCTIVHELFHISLELWFHHRTDFQELTSKTEFCWQKSALKWTPLITLLKHIYPCGIYTYNTFIPLFPPLFIPNYWNHPRFYRWICFPKAKIRDRDTVKALKTACLHANFTSRTCS